VPPQLKVDILATGAIEFSVESCRRDTPKSPAFAEQDHGTADEAKAMLLKAVAGLKADKAKTLDLINEGKGGFLDRDLYVFCANNSDGKVVALGNPNAKQ
jgi:hypothetical protein